MCCTLILLGLAGLAQAQPPSKPGGKELPPEARKAVVQASAEIRKIRDQLIESLGRQQEAETRKGNLDGALAIREEIERLKAGGEIRAYSREEAQIRSSLIGGKWRLSIVGNAYGADWEFHDDDTLVITDSNGKTETRWTLQSQGKNSILQIALDPPHAMQFTVTQPGKRFQGLKPGTRERIELNRQP